MPKDKILKMAKMAKLSSSVPLTAVIEDDPSVLKALGRLLRSAGYGVRLFATPHDCLNAWEISLPQCYIIDVQLPEMDGFELLTQLRQKGCQAPVIFITAYDTPRAWATAKLHESIGLFIKPFDETKLLRALDQIIEIPQNPSH